MKLLLLATFFLLTTSGVQGSDDGTEDETIELQIPQGRLKGMKKSTTIGERTFYSYHAIPFAKPPVGELRLKDPEVWEDWEGVLDATKPTPICPQFVFNEGFAGQEDCLYLNVYTPKSCEEGCNLQSHSNLPVMVFIHGGGFYLGHADLYFPEAFMDHDVVMVVLQYRLGTLGFFSTGDSAIPGNFGLKDQTMALRWVQSHIAYFGGNPFQVTIFGESAGGASVHYHILSPSSTGLFSKAIMQSGSSLGSWALRDDHKKSAITIAKHFNCSLENNELLECLQSLDLQSLVMTQNLLTNSTLQNYMTPRVDGWFLPDEPEVLLREGRHNQVHVISGHTSGEGAILIQFLQFDMKVYEDFIKNFEDRGAQLLGINNENTKEEIMRKIIDYYVGRPAVQENDEHQLIQMYGDKEFVIPHELHSWWYVNTTEYHGKRTFLYEFKYVGPFNFLNLLNLTTEEKWNYAYHGDELFYQFKFVDTVEGDDLKMLNIMVQTWVNFAIHGHPTPDDELGFIWTEASKESWRHLVIEPTPFMEDDQKEEVREFWTSLPLERLCYLRTHDNSSSTWFDMVRSYVLPGDTCSTAREGKGLPVLKQE
ncbi:esterase E4-like [Oratosquilla oratoria]|uniref:esterase E4-like n=1 Tax=Oratosquilla oratoria TaxID=337810 RepID=UPI003F76D059